MGELLETLSKHMWIQDKNTAQKKAAPICDRIKNNEDELKTESVKSNDIILKQKFKADWFNVGTLKKTTGGVAGSSSSFTSLS